MPHPGPRGLLLLVSLAFGIAAGGRAALPDDEGKLYQIVDGKVDARTYNGFRRYHAVCNHCHGPDGSGSSFGPSLVERLIDIDAFRRTVREGSRNGAAVMKGFAGDPNIEPYIDDIYAYLQARADGALGRGRPTKAGQ
ncbi:MAG TPA: c-type cytochrome [Dongiaceae bacterium]|nr:c-type cytochrome [Dongiaceae bacterium]